MSLPGGHNERIAVTSNRHVRITSRFKEEIVTQARGVDKGDEIEAQRDPQVQAALKALEKN